MQLYVMRHAEALPVGSPGIHRDAERTLSDDGRRDATRASLALERLGIAIDLILTSPYPRAVETATIVASQVTHAPQPQPEPRLQSGVAEVDDLLALIAKHSGQAEAILLVGHEPALGELVGQLATGSPASLPLQTSSVAAFSAGTGLASPRLDWYAGRRMLKQLAR